MISTKDFIKLVEDNIKEYDDFSKNVEVIQVWYSKNIQNHKGMFIVRDKDDNLIYDYYIEATYNGDARELYLDFYSKIFKHTIKIN
ncbi:DUF6275 family protein [Clostridium sp.]|uniref:DUF6275 family protein n=1 Tax=Clostridium sp. TaxID=1506 RepID=UPI0025BB57AA|nr:DUF6275 family protein [Clostridium sp.]